MAIFGGEIDKQNILKDDLFYITPNEFTNFIRYILYQYMLGYKNKGFKVLYDPSNEEIRSINDDFSKNYINDLLKVDDIFFSEQGYIYKDQNEEMACVSPEFFMLQLCENLKRKSAEVYEFYKNMEHKMGGDVLNTIDFGARKKELKDFYHDLSLKTKGAYKLTDDYSITYLRTIEACSQIEKTILEVRDEIIHYFSSDFDEWRDPKFVEEKEALNAMLDKSPRQDKTVSENGQIVQYFDTEYFKLEQEVMARSDQAMKEAFARYSKQIATSKKIAINEYIRILKNTLKSKIISYSYKTAERTRMGCITSFGLDEILYYAHPRDKYDYERKNDHSIGNDDMDYDYLYLYNDSDDSLENDQEMVTRHINL